MTKAKAKTERPIVKRWVGCWTYGEPGFEIQEVKGYELPATFQLCGRAWPAANYRSRMPLDEVHETREGLVRALRLERALEIDRCEKELRRLREGLARLQL